MKKVIHSMRKWPLVGLLVALALLLGAWYLMGGTFPFVNEIMNGTDSGESTSQSGAKTVAQVIAGIEYGSRFSQLLASTGVGSSLTGKGPYTVFVSTDGAFGRLVPGTVNNLSASEKKRLVQYHIVSGKKLDVDAVQNSQIQALSRDTINFQVDAQKNAYVNSGKVIETYKATNGIVYVINAVLVPPKPIQ